VELVAAEAVGLGVEEVEEDIGFGFGQVGCPSAYLIVRSCVVGEGGNQPGNYFAVVVERYNLVV